MTSVHGDLNLGDILVAAGVHESELLCVRHTVSAASGLHRAATAEEILKYTRRQQLKPGKMPSDPPALWLIFMADGRDRSRFLTAFENHGEITDERTDIHRFFDLSESDTLRALKNRLVINWSSPINWTRVGSRAREFPVVEIADPQVVAFPGFDRVLISYSELQDLVEDARWTQWRAALQAVQGIYLIADSSTGQLYVGKADGRERILGRWTTYARDGHGGNVAMKAVVRSE